MGSQAFDPERVSELLADSIARKSSARAFAKRLGLSPSAVTEDADRELIERIVQALNEAIVQRG